MPDAAQVVCDANGTTILTPTVRPRGDGVHIQIRNETGEDLAFVVGDDGDNAPAGASEIVWPLAPGITKIGCADASGPPGEPEGGVTVVDTDGLWSDPSVRCDEVTTGTFDFAAGAEGERGDPADIAKTRLHDRLRPGDVVRAAGYPDAPERHVIVVRDGSTIADLRYVQDESGLGWLEGAETTCPAFAS